MENNTTEDQPVVTTEATAEPPIGQCPICGKLFKNKLAVTMHMNRVHTAKIKVPGQTREEQLARRREYQRNLRERYKQEGKDSRGYPKKGNKARTGTKWTDEQRRKFNKTWAAKKNSPQQETKSQHLDDPRGFINCCPHCGGELAAFYLAAGAMARRAAK